MPQDQALRAAAEAICNQLCDVAAGSLDVRLDVSSSDVTAQKLAMLGNAVLHVARRAVAAAEASKRDLASAHEIARLATWRADLIAGTKRSVWSPELFRLLGADPARFHPDDATRHGLVHPEDRARVAAAHQRAMQGSTESYEWRANCPDGVTRFIWTELRPVLQGDTVVQLNGVCQDVTERHLAEARIRHLAEHDVLTGLVNRTVLYDRLGQALAHQGRRRGKPAAVAVLCLDLDGFKAVNDHHGHAAGDQLLKQAARRMRALVRSSDTLARLGGDEFVIAQIASEQPAAANQLATRIVETLAKPYDLGDGREAITVSVSIGVAIAPADGDQVETLLAAADTAMYRAKANGRNGMAFFHAGMEREARERRAIEADLRQAACRNELSVHYQPLVDVASGTVLGFEALVRWLHSQRGLVPPDVFIAIAEGNGTILRLGEWVLEQACAEAARWAKPHFVAVNVSPVQVQRGVSFAEMVEAVLKRTGLEPARLELEVTEGVLIRDADAALKALARLRKLGVRIALDDFGTGYSSLATLQSFPFDKIKVDRRFIAGLGGVSGQDAAIVRAVLGLARGLGVPVVAEGVETTAQLEALRLEGCAEAQGWLFGRPTLVPAGMDPA